MSTESPSATEAASYLPAVLMLLVGLQLLPVVDGIAKYLSAEYSVLLLAWGRYVSHLAAVLPVAVWRHGREALWPRKPWLQLARGALLVVATLCFFGAVSRMPVADAIAVVFVYPFIVTALSALLLGEAVGRRRWTAVATGFLGVLVVARPGGEFDPVGTPLAIGAGVSFASYTLITRRLAGSAPPLVGLAFTAVVGAVVMTLALPWTWQPVTPHALGLMVLMGVLTATGHGLVMRAYETAPASLLAPLGYTEIVGAVLVGLALFGDFPDPVTWLGIAIIVASGVYISVRERRRGVRPPRSAAPPG